MKIIRKSNVVEKFLVESRNIERSAYIWNMIAAMSNSFQSMLMMLIVTRTGNVEGASYIAIGFASANLLMTIGKFGMRNFQVTDVSENYNFYCYKYSRYITVSGMIICSVGYCLIKLLTGDYSLEKMLVVLLFCVYKVIESLEDVYHGRLQQLGRLDIAAKIWAVRNITFILEFTVAYLFLRWLLPALCITIVTTIVLYWILNSMSNSEYKVGGCKEKTDVWQLLRKCLPIAIAMFLLMYISNAPKYIIDANISDEEQTYFNVLFMTIYVVTLLSNFLYNPLLNKMAVLWKEGKRKELMKKISCMEALVLGIVLVGMLFAEIIGRKLLGWIYGLDLEAYKLELRLMIIAGGLIAIMNLLYMVIILLRKQKIFYLVFSIATVALLLFGTRILEMYALIGVCFFYDIVILLIDIALTICMLKIINRKKR